MTDGRAQAKTSWAWAAIALVALLVGVYARVWHLLATPLWLDEAYSRFAADQGWWFLWHVVPRYETHPPFYYSLLHLWTLAFGHSLLSLRIPGLLCGFATIVMIARCAGALARLIGVPIASARMVMAVAAAYAALDPMLIYATRQARPYPLMVVAYAIGILALLRLADDAAMARPLRRGWIAAFFGMEAAMLWLHSLGPLYGLTMTVALAVAVIRPTLGRHDWAWLVGGQIVAGLLYLPAFAILIVEARGWVHATWLRFDPATIVTTLEETLAGPLPLIDAVAVLALAAGVAALAMLRHGRRPLVALALLCALPPVLSILISWLVSPVLLARTLAPVAVPFVLLVTSAAAARGYRLLIALLLAALLLLTTIYDLRYAELPPGEDWSAAIAWLIPRETPSDAVWAYPNETALPLGYALEDRGTPVPVVQIPAAVPALGFPGAHPTGTAGVVALDAGQIERLAASPAARAPRILWLAQLAPRRIDPGDRLLKALLRARRPVAVYQVNEIRIIGLRRR